MFGFCSCGDEHPATAAKAPIPEKNNDFFIINLANVFSRILQLPKVAKLMCKGLYTKPVDFGLAMFYFKLLIVCALTEK